ncbi:fibroblast growth factor receptor substrate 2 [Harpegnathos saltator]|uniref:Fibroblast growth factor receptor substrate 2 n=1 Tax=Harpegnathos saltator TaxID=610380 RepID=E2BJ44_HARSA|nr:fibroblast growth factor receptor substrate 2 [Harpegnathos saltator]XP_025159693.1 fibroblast growth factor receptor substrate 2 [Harpegnathos saltator]EFN84194.1 Fibroblast growth factor receptor substrate 2 [Harpegnathos saltator]
MGCINSRADINDLHPNVFQVINVDELGNSITPGRLEVTEVELILYQRGKQPIKWSLRCLRRYGYDASIFSFESGRRCFTGPAIYAFKCQRAQQLFNLVQRNIQMFNNSGDDSLSDLPLGYHPAAPLTNTNRSCRVTIPEEPNYLDPTPTRSNRVGSRFTHSPQNGVGRLNSVGSSNSPMSPQGTMGSPSPPPISIPPSISQTHPSSLYINEEVWSSIPVEVEHNNNKSLGNAMQRSLQLSTTIDNSTTADSGLMETELISIQNNAEANGQQDVASQSLPVAPYVNIDICGDKNPITSTPNISEPTPAKEENNDAAESESSSEHEYMNIGPGRECIENVVVRVPPPPLPVLPFLQTEADVEDGSKHYYSNLDPSEIESLRNRYSGASVAEKSPLLPSTPTGCPIREVNYAVLDLDTKDVPTTTDTSESTVNSMPPPPQSPSKLQKGYATIDFNKTAALLNSTNLVNDNEGSRKTRHNSTISDLTVQYRHNSSVSE